MRWSSTGDDEFLEHAATLRMRMLDPMVMCMVTGRPCTTHWLPGFEPSQLVWSSGEAHIQKLMMKFKPSMALTNPPICIFRKTMFHIQYTTPAHTRQSMTSDECTVAFIILATFS